MKALYWRDSPVELVMNTYHLILLEGGMDLQVVNVCVYVILWKIQFILTCFTAIMCEGIAAPRNGQILYSAEGEDGFPVGTVANISCDPSYLLIGNDTRVCMANESMNGEWSGTTPTCAGKISIYEIININSLHFLTVITCPELEPIDNGYFQYQTETGVYIIGTTVQYTCNSSYILMGQSQRTCELNEQDGSSGTWSGEAPLCLGEYTINKRLKYFET